MRSALRELRKRIEPQLAIAVVVIDVFTPIPTRSHVIQRTSKLKS